MKNPILCGLLVMATGGGVAFVVANRPTPVPLSEVTTAATEIDTPDPSVPCVKCQTGAAGVTDVTNLSTKFAAKSEAQGGVHLVRRAAAREAEAGRDRRRA